MGRGWERLESFKAFATLYKSFMIIMRRGMSRRNFRGNNSLIF